MPRRSRVDIHCGKVQYLGSQNYSVVNLEIEFTDEGWCGVNRGERKSFGKNGLHSNKTKQGVAWQTIQACPHAHQALDIGKRFQKTECARKV